MLQVNNLVTSINDKQILQDLSLQINPGEVHALMGPNGSGKSTLASTLMGHLDYVINKGALMLDGQSLNDLAPEDRARAGLFLAFQHPIAIPGVSVANFLRAAVKHVQGAQQQMAALEFFKHLKSLAAELQLPEELLKRSLNEGLSGGERKKMETLQMLILKPKYIILDEIDTGTDVDALKILGTTIEKMVRGGEDTKEHKSLKAEGLNGQENPNEIKNLNAKKQLDTTNVKRNTNNDSPGVLLITHYSRIFQYIKPDYVHILKQGQIVKSGGYELVEEIEKNGYGEF